MWPSDAVGGHSFRKSTGICFVGADKARRLFLEEWQDMATLELAAHDYLPLDAVDLKN
jgi:hypothetical protein